MITKCPKCGHEFNPTLANLEEMVTAKYGKKFVKDLKKELKKESPVPNKQSEHGK